MVDSSQFASDNPTPVEPTPSDRAPELPLIELPLAIAAAIAQRMQQSGQTQAQVILEALQLALSPTQPDPEPDLDGVEQTELRSLKQRLADLEALVPRMVALEGKSIAF